MTTTVAVALVLLIAVWLVRGRVGSGRRNRILNESITNNMPSGVVTVDEAGKVTFHNPAAQRIFGSALGTGVRLADLVVTSDRLQDLVRHAIDEGDTFSREEFEIRNSQTGARQIGMSVSPISGSGMRAAGALCILSDLTEVVRLQRELRLKENFAALGEMSAGITHEFKNSLAAISGYAQMLERESDPQRVRTHARELVSNTRRLTRVVSDFLQFARPVEPALKPVAIGQVVADAVGELQKQRGEADRIDFDPPDGSFVVQADETLLGQAILNVLINAVEAVSAVETGQNSAIHLSVEFVPGPESPNSGQAVIAVRDDGPGVRAEDLDRVLIPFFTTKPGGAGLGLSLVQKIVMAHGGSFQLRNRPEHGAEALVALPAVATQTSDRMEPSGLRPA